MIYLPSIQSIPPFMRRRKRQLLLLQIFFEFLAVKFPNFHCRPWEPIFVLLHLKNGVISSRENSNIGDKGPQARWWQPCQPSGCPYLGECSHTNPVLCQSRFLSTMKPCWVTILVLSLALGDSQTQVVTWAVPMWNASWALWFCVVIALDRAAPWV